MSDHEGQGHKAVLYKSHFPATKALHSQTVVTETPTDTLANKPRLTKDQALFVILAPTTLTYQKRKNLSSLENKPVK